MNALLRPVAPSATRMIRMDHAHVLGLFHKLTPDISQGARLATVRSICTALEIHAQLEEEIFYPALRALNLGLPELDKSVPEHDEVRRHIEQVRALEATDANFDERVSELMRGVIHHVADEETVLLPIAEHRLADQLDELGARMTERRMELAKPHAGQLAMDMVRASPAKASLLLAGVVAAGALLVARSRRSHAPRLAHR